jgi:hypothetical protein
VLHGLEQAAAAGFTHVLTMDADGQHPAQLIAEFMQASLARPDAMILDRPIFDASAPLLRVRGRRVSNWWTNLETLGAGVASSRSTWTPRSGTSAPPKAASRIFATAATTRC